MQNKLSWSEVVCLASTLFTAYVNQVVQQVQVAKFERSKWIDWSTIAVRYYTSSALSRWLGKSPITRFSAALTAVVVLLIICIASNESQVSFQGHIPCTVTLLQALDLAGAIPYTAHKIVSEG